MDNLVKARVLKNFTSTALGNLSTGQIVNITPSRLIAWKNNGMVEPVKSGEAVKVDEIAPEPATKTITKNTRKKSGKKRK